MKIKYTALALALAVSATAVNADVELKSSDDDQLLVNGTAAQMVPHIYGADGQKISEFNVISPALYEPLVLLNLEDKTIGLELDADGSYRENDSLKVLHDEDCKLIGVQGANGFINTTSFVMPVGGELSVYDKGTASVEGYEYCGDGQELITGTAVTYNPNLTASVAAFMKNLSTPLSIK